MKQQVNRKQIMFYIWTGVAYMLFWILIDIGNNEDHIGLRILNNIWRAIYITFINFFFFEYLLSIIRRKRISIIINILLGIILVCAELMLCTFGLYVWRAIGIGLHVYTSLREFTSVSQAIGYGVPAGIFS